MIQKALSLLGSLAFVVCIYTAIRGVLHMADDNVASGAAALLELRFALDAGILFAVCAVGLALYEIDARH